MARRSLAVVTLSVAGIVGCQSTQPPTAGLPAPNFAGPVITQPAFMPPPVVAYVPPPKTPATPRPAPVMRGIPAAWIPLASAEHRQWKWIVIHHSATPTGGAVAFDKEHKAKGWDGLGYHFVIGNGTDTPDGCIEVGYRWPIQQHGAHAKTPDNQYNEHGIGICLVGNFDVTRPTPKQMASLEKLVTYLATTYHISTNNILGHKMTKPTDCPGRNMSIAVVRAAVAKQEALAGIAPDEEPTEKPGAELMMSAAR